MKFSKTAVLLSLTDDKEEPLTKHNARSFDVKFNPGDANSATYKMSVRILDGTENLRQTLKWAKDVQRVIQGTAPANRQLRRSC